MSEKTLNKEVELPIMTNGQYKNLQVKNKYKVEGGKKVVDKQGLNPGEYITVVKAFPEGKEFPSRTYFKDKEKTQPQLSYLVVVEYKGEQVSFFLKEHEHNEFKTLPLGEKFKMGVIKDSFVNPKNAMETFFDKIVFEMIR